MLYRKLGGTGLKVSALGFGAMRFPLEGNPESIAERFNPETKVDEAEALRMIEYAVRQGINYFDTAYPYHGGQSERIVGKGLKPHREKVFIATKLPTMMLKKQEEFEPILNEQLGRLDTDFIDLYLAHGLSRAGWHRMKEAGMIEFMDRIKADGRVHHVGFSFHDDVRAFKEIVDGYDWEFAQIQYNYFDEHNQAGREGLDYAASKGLGIVIMEPLRGGKLAGPVPEKIQEIWDRAEVKRTPAEWALRWVWNHPEVSVVLSGMSTMQQLIENVQTVQGATAGSLSSEELSLIKKAKIAYREMMKVDCTTCGYCMPCPIGVDIPVCFHFYNDLHVFEKDSESSVVMYNRVLPSEKQASACIECGECEEKCPQQIPIREKLKEVHEAMSKENAQSGH